MTPAIKTLEDTSLQSENWNKSNLIQRIMEKEGCTRREATEILALWVKVIEDGLLQQKKILLTGFGTFQISHRKAFKGYDPMNDVEIVIPIRHVPVFKASKLFKAQMNRDSGV